MVQTGGAIASPVFVLGGVGQKESPERGAPGMYVE